MPSSAGEAGIEIEAASDISDYLISQGYSSADAHTEANAIAINGLVGQTDSGPAAAQTRLSQVADLSASLASKPSSTALGDNDPLFKAIESLLEAPSVAASNVDLARLDSLYGTKTPNADSPDIGQVNSYA